MGEKGEQNHINLPEVVPLRLDEVHRLLLPWDSFLNYATLSEQVRKHPHLAWRIRNTHDFALGGYWRGRTEVGTILEVSPSRYKDILVDELVDAFRQEGCLAIVLSPHEIHRDKGWYTQRGWHLLDQLLIYERPGPFPLTPHTPPRLFLDEDVATIMRIEEGAFPWLWCNSPTDFLSYAHSPDVTVYMSESGSKSIGYVSFTLKEQQAHLDRLAVQPLFQRQGYATYLLECVMNVLNQRRIKRMTLSTQDGNHKAHRFYEKLGFRKTGERYPIYGLWLTPTYIPHDAKYTGNSLQPGENPA